MNWYTIVFAAMPLPIHWMKTWYNLNTIFLMVFYVIDDDFGYKGYLHKQFNKICKYSIIFNVIIVILTYQLVITDPFKILLLFNGSVFATTIMIVISGGRHGIFKD